MIKLTSKRKLVYDIFKKSQKPINAEMIYEKLNKEVINLSTIYRAIDYFNENDLLISFHFNNKTYYILNDKDDHYHYFICVNCLHMESIKCNMKPVIESLTNDYNYQINNHEMTIYGLCDLCHI